MKSLILLLLTILLCLTTTYAANMRSSLDTAQVNGTELNTTGLNITEPIILQSIVAQPKCSSSSLYILFEQYYQGHPFRNANINRSKSHWDMSKFEIQTISMANYSVENKVGGGCYGKVFKTTHIPTGKSYAFKQLVELHSSELKKEIQVMRDVEDIPNVLPIRGIVKETDENGKIRAGLIVEFFKAEKYDTLFPKLSKYQIKLFIYQTLETLSAAHSKGIVHRDISRLNVMMNAETNQAKVIDWGLSEYWLPNKDYKTDIATLYYKSPEMLLEYRQYDYALDVWATGCLLAEMIFMKDLMFEAEEVPLTDEYKTTKGWGKFMMLIHKEQLIAIAKVLGTLQLKQFADKFKDEIDVRQMEGIPDFKKVPFSAFVNETNAHLYDPRVEDLLEKLLTYDHTRRITAGEALIHPYFEEVHEAMASNLLIDYVSCESYYELSDDIIPAKPAKAFRLGTGKQAYMERN